MYRLLAKHFVCQPAKPEFQFVVQQRIIYHII
jgi:hypothetical protein